jgi:hypothetical protein
MHSACQALVSDLCLLEGPVTQAALARRFRVTNGFSSWGSQLITSFWLLTATLSGSAASLRPRNRLSQAQEVPSDHLFRRSMEPVRLVLRSPESQVSALLSVRNGRPSPVQSIQSIEICEKCVPVASIADVGIDNPSGADPHRGPGQPPAARMPPRRRSYECCAPSPIAAPSCRLLLRRYAGGRDRPSARLNRAFGQTSTWAYGPYGEPVTTTVLTGIRVVNRRSGEYRITYCAFSPSKNSRFPASC